MFERFTTDARAVVVGAQGHARRLGHRFVGTEHLVRAIVDRGGPTTAVLAAAGITATTMEADIAARHGQGRDAARRALASIGIDLDAVLASIGADLDDSTPSTDRRRHRRRPWSPRRRCPAPGPPTRTLSHLPFSPRSKRCLELALREALRVGSKAITTEHLLLGILREGRGLACRILDDRGVSISELRHDLERQIRHTA